MTTREVTIEGGSPWGFRMHGGADVQQPLKISRVNPGSKAALKGIREGDVISSINGESTKDKTNAEAHQLLKGSGDLLKLGLNEDGGSPKKRQFRSVQQETHSETVKRTNATTQIVTTTTKQETHHRTESGKNESNEKGLEGKSGQVNGANDHLQGQDCFSEKSTISSNYSSTVSTPLTETNSQGSRAEEEEMPKRRKRNGGNKKKTKANGEPTSKAAEEYRVESPKTVKEEKKVVKSRSLDDDDASIKIQEISSECGTNPNQTEPNPTQVVIEPIEDQKESVHKMNTESLKIDQPNATRISPEDESNLRSFLQTLHLPATPEEALNEKESAEAIKAKRAKKREELAQYFLPVYQNPRYLDVISEENSDHSDKEGKDKTEVKKPKIQRYIPKVPYHNPNQKKVETVMIETGDIETPIISTTCTVSMMEQSSGGVEVVFLDEESQSEDEDDEFNEDGDVLSSQLTPPPTPDNLSPKEIEITQIDQQTPSQPLQKSSALSPTLPSRSPSHDREDSSSRGTSLCTTICVNLELKSLRELCLDKLISLPFGKEVLEELANVSKSLQELTNNLATEQKQPETNACDFGIAEKGEMDQADAWVGIRTEDDPQVVVCFSPTQKEYLDTTKSVPREADKLLDLHKKFIERSYYSDTEILEPTESFKGDSRLLPFIHEFKPIKPIQNHENPRLHAKNLHEWLQLARSNKSTSELNLSVIGENHYHQKRRKSLPNELYIQQMQSIIQKEKEIQHELEKLEEEKRKLQNEMTAEETQQNNYKFDPTKYHISKNEDIAIHTEELKRPILKPTQPSTEKFRKQMFDEYMQEIAERNERKHQKVIKVSNHQDIETAKDTRQSRGIEEEFMTKLKQKRYCHRSSEEKDELNGESERDESQVKVITCGKPISDTKRLPKHLKEFVDITREASENLHVDGDPDEGCGIWTPGRRDSFSSDDLHHQQSADLQDGGKPEDPIAPVWTPKSAGSSPQPERKEFRPLNFTSPVLGRKNKPNGQQRADEGDIEPPWRGADVLSAHLGKRIPNSHSAPPSGFGDLSQAPRLPRAQNPTITLLQKAREGQIPKGASYIEDPPLPPKKRESPPKISPGEIVYEIKHEYTSESENEKPRKIADLGPRKITGIGPTTREGMPLTLRSEVRDQNQSRWYKKMYDTIHKQRPRYDGNYPYTSGYVSEPEPGAYDSDTGYYHSNINHSTLDRRRTMDSKGDTFTATYTVPRTIGTSRTMQSDVIKHGKDSYKNQPGRIENYIPGHSSISEKEAKEWWDEVMDIFDGWLDDHSALPSYNYMLARAITKNHLEQQKHIPSKGYMSQALKESGYESDSTLVFRRRDDALNQLSSSEHREAYKTIQKGGDVPLHGLRKPAPERPKGFEYIPISPTLTKIRVRKSSPTGRPQEEILVYPITIESNENLFKNYKRTAPSGISKLLPIPPSPPKRKSSRNNSTLRLISTMKIKDEVRPKEIGKRHETCFISGSRLNKSGNVKYLRDKITCKLSPLPKKKGETRLRVTKTVCASPELKSKISSTLTTSKDPKSSINRVYSRTNISDPGPSGILSRSSSVSSLKKSCRSCSTGAIKKSHSKPETRTSSLDRTFGTEKRKIGSFLTKSASEKRLLKSPELLSPTEVKKAGSFIQKSSKSVLSSVRNGTRSPNKTQTIPVQVTITDKGKEVLRKSRKTCISPALSTSSDKSRISKASTSMESLKSIKSPIKRESALKKDSKVSKTKEGAFKKDSKSTIKKSTSYTKLPKPKEPNGSPQHKPKETVSTLKKSKKNQLNGEIAKKEKETLIKPSLEDIKRQKQTVETDSFFQNLFLRDVQPIQKSETFSTTSSWIAEKTKALERRSSIISEPSIGALKIYLNNRKPVSDSKFKILDATRSRSASPKSVRFDYRSYPKKSFYNERSISLPPKLTRTSPTTVTQISHEPIRKPPEKLFFTETIRPITPPLQFQPEYLLRSRSSSRSSRPSRSNTPETLYFSQTRRPISPYSSNQSICTSETQTFRSPSYRKIQKSHADTIEFIKSKIPRSRSAGAADDTSYKTSIHSNLQSSSSIESFQSKKDYQEYVRDLVQSKRKSERFKELNRFYSTIERLGELEKATSSSDLKPRGKFEDEIIDYDRWKEVRRKERAEKEMNDIYKELKGVQKEKDLLFLPKDVHKWKKHYESGLRIKEKSVDNIKEDFEKLQSEEDERNRNKLVEMQLNKDVYKPLWRGSSVINLAQTMVEKRSPPKPSNQNKKIDSHLSNTYGFGSRIWSSLSMEQVNSLKNQLAEIYQNGHPSQSNQTEEKPNENYYVDVPKDISKQRKIATNLSVRRNSDSSKSKRQEESLSEIDKKKISQSLSQEILERQRQKYRTSISLVLAKETRGAIAAAEANVKVSPSSPRTCYSLEVSEDGDTRKQKDELLIVLDQPKEPKTALVKTNATELPTKQSSNSETESTDESTRTVLCVDTKEVKKKVEYFEHVHEIDEFTPTIYKPAEPSDSVTNKEENNNVIHEDVATKKGLIPSQSCQDFKELFGECDSAKASSPISRTTSRCSKFSDRSQNGSRGASPNPELYYLSLAKSGDVKKLKTKFDSIRRCNSDSEIHRSEITFPGLHNGEVDNLRRKYEYPHLAGRGRSRIRRGGVVSPIFLKAEDRYMPHINIISKIAALYPKKSRGREKQKSVEELAEILGISVGEVEKLRRRFDSPDRMSLLGHMFTSSPNLNELKDIAPYLTASWTAHKYPKKEDNTRKLTDANGQGSSSMDTSLVKKSKLKKPKTSSSSSAKVKLSSILKPLETEVAKKAPSSPKTPSSRYSFKSWWPATQSKNSVTFSEEPEAPVPPPKGSRRKAEYQESPRKYVENEVTIHYKTPVRQEVKEAVSEDELQRRQAEHMKKVYQEERRRKYLQELQDMNNRRHTDNFIPSQKSPIPLNRYDDFLDDYSPKVQPRPRSPEARLVAKALYNFLGQTARELTFRKGDVIYIRRQIDKNWYEGEHNAMVGLFPANYVEILPHEGPKATIRKPHEGQARAKYNFIAQTHLELSLAKGETVVVTRRVDDNWFEGKVGARKGIFPVSYVEVLVEPGDQATPRQPSKPVAAPASHSLMVNGKESMGAHSYVPQSQASSSSYHAKPVQVSGGSDRGQAGNRKNPLSQELHVDTQSEPYVPYRALYKYKPQNEDEIELNEGDTVYVLEKCDDGWFVGASERTGALGTFPGNYVERI